MKKRRNIFRRKKAQSMEDEATILSPDVILKCGKQNVRGIACISTHELIAVATLSRQVYVHEYSTQGKPVRVFNGHKSFVRGVAHLSDDILASIDDGGTLLTWRAGTCIVLDKINVPKTREESHS